MVSDSLTAVASVILIEVLMFKSTIILKEMQFCEAV